jgi:phosphatidate cytidylyltransferase
VDDVPDGREDDVTRTDVPVVRAEPTGPSTDQVRIIGAEPAGESTAELPKVSRDDDVLDGEDPGPLESTSDDSEPTRLFDGGFDQPSVRLTDQPGDPGAVADAVDPVAPGGTAVPTGGPTELPHWTEPPTGQVPAVLARDAGDEGSGPGIAGPSWREEDSDWEAHDEVFEPGVLGDDEVALGSLDETDRTDIDRRPWEFDVDPSESGQHHLASARFDATNEPIADQPDIVASSKGRVQGEDDDLPSTPARPTERPGPGMPAGAAAAAGLGVVGAQAASGAGSSLIPENEPSVEDELFAADKPLPTGSTRMGKARRAGLLPTRLRAKRAGGVGEAAATPLAAEPPGASVTDVPGAGRKPRGVAGLAAADRTAEREGEVHTDETATASVGVRSASEEAAVAAVSGVVATKPKRRPFRRSGEPRTAPPAGGAGTRATGGGGPPRPTATRRPTAGAGTAGSRAGNGSVGVRVGTGLAVAVVALLAFKAGTVPSLVLVVIVVTFAAGECFGAMRGAGYHPATLLGLVGTISLTVGAYSKGVAALPLVLVLITAFTLIWYLIGVERGSPVAGTAATLLTVGWVSLLGSYAGLLLSPSSFPDRHGIAFLLGAIIATVANDVGALVIGGWIGRTPLAPTISPNKTWEGLLGGAVLSILVSTVVVGAIHPWSASDAALLGVVVAVVAPIGDLCESLLKRDLRLKDMGTLLPGHGGVLDRVDALLFVLPATYYLVRALNIA